MTRADSLTVEISFLGIQIDSTLFDRQLPLPAYEPTLGMPDRSCELAGPAPVGHRNNILRCYDRVGILHLEGRSTRQVEEATVVLDCELATPSTTDLFTGSLTVFGGEMFGGMSEKDVNRPAEANLGHVRSGSWSTRSDRVYVGLRCTKRRTASGSRAKESYVAQVCVGFSD